MSRHHPWYKRYPSDFIAGTAMLTDAEKGVYSTIIDMLHDKGGPIEGSDADLARICGCATVKRFQGIKERLVKLGKIAVAEGHITNARFERDRARSPDENPTTDHPQNPPPDLLEINGLAAPRGQRPEARGQKVSGRRAGARTTLTSDFALLAEQKAYALAQGFEEAKILTMFEQFCDHHRARGNAMADWGAAWRTWCRNEIRFNGTDGHAKTSNVANGNGNRPFADRGTRGDRRPTRDDAILAGMGKLADRMVGSRDLGGPEDSLPDGRPVRPQ
jgi:hypothetical protein